MPKFLSKFATFTIVLLIANFAAMLNVSAEVPYSLWGANGVTLDTTTGDDEVNHHTIVGAGAGGAYIAWIRSPLSGEPVVYVQRVNSNGLPQWTAGGVQASTSAESQTYPQLLATSDGVIVAWLEYDTANLGSTVYVQKFNTSGAIQWGATGVDVTSSFTTHKSNFYIASDSNDGVVISWLEARDAMTDIYMQRLDTNGDRLWGDTGSPAYADTLSNVIHYKMRGDESGGAYVVWSQARSGSINIYGQILSTAGGQRNDPAGIIITEEPNTQFISGLVHNGSGVTMVWEDEQVDRDLIGQSMDSGGNLLWGSGVAISPSSAVSFALEDGIASDGAGGVFVLWDDSDNELFRAQRVDSTGTLLWNADGVGVVDNSYATNVSMINTNGSDLIIVWDHNFTDGLGDEYIDVNSQYIDASGDIKWGANGLAIYHATFALNSENKPEIVNDNDIGGIVVWSPEDELTGNNYEVRAQGVTHAYQIANLDAALDAVDDNDNNIELGTVNGLVGDDELVRVTKDADGTVISDVLTDMIQDHDWDIVLGDNDLASGKAVITGLGTAPGTAGVHTLYVPFVSGDTQLVICPDAANLSEVTDNCTNQVIFSEGETKTVGSDSVSVSKVTINSQVYWAAAGVSGTGGFSTAEAALPSTGINQESLIVAAMFLISLGSLGAVKSLRRGI